MIALSTRAVSRFFSLLVVALIVISSAQPAAAITPSSASGASSQSLTFLPTRGDGARRDYHPETGKLRYLGASYGSTIALPNTLDAGLVAADPAMAALSVYGPEFGLNDPAQELQAVSASTENTHLTKYQQTYQGLPVIGGELIVNTDAQGHLLSISGEVSPEPALSTAPAITADDARATALSAVAKWHSVSDDDLVATEPQLSVFDERLLRPGARPVELVWRLEVRSAGLDPINELVLVNAQTGGISLHFNQIDEARAVGETASTSTAPAFVLAPPFAAPTLFGTGGAVAVGIGDLNGDSRQDVVISTQVDQIQVFNQKADGTLETTPLSYFAGGRLESLAVGDVNNDNRADVVAVNFNDNTISVLLQQANGTFASRATHPTSSGPDSVAIGDVNNDGRNDVVVSHWTAAAIGVFTQKSDNTLNAMVSYPSPQAGYDDIATGDVNGDGRLDVVKMNGQGLNPNLSVYLQNSGGTLDSAISYSVGASCPSPCLGQGIAIGDVTGDGKADVAMSHGGNSPNARMSVFAQNSGGTLDAAVSYPAYDIPEPVEISDINSDGRLDVVTVQGGWLRAGLFPQQSNGTLASYSLYPIPYASHYKPQGLAIGDLNNDGLPDMAIADYNNTLVVLYQQALPATGGVRSTYTANNGSGLPGTFLCNQNQSPCTVGDAHANAAHLYAAQTYDFYKTYHNRDSIDNAGLTIISTVHYKSGYANAFWNGSQMVYGDAYGFPLADDVVAHELTHGVTQYESNLFYYYQSGAINEALSDIWGEFVDQTNGQGNDSPGVKWLMGEDVSGLGALRNMANPPAFGDPDKMTSPLYYGGDGDNGGVHTNSGVLNKAAFLIADGGVFNGKAVTGLGITKAAPVFYETQTNMLTSGSDYADVYNALYQACLNLVGGSQGITYNDCLEVRDATDAVEMNKQPLTGSAPEAALCPANTALLNTLFSDDLESGPANWTFSAVSGFSSWSRTTDYAASSLYMLWGNDANTNSDSVAAMNLNVALPPGAQAYLHFKHAFGFEDYLGRYYDGGWLEYSTNGGGSWNDAGPLFSGGQNYNGSIIAGFGNPNAGHQALIADSHGYVSSRFDLSSLAGQNIRFRWRMSTDPSFSDLGWVVDDVRLHTCVPVPTVPVLTAPANNAFLTNYTPVFDWGDSANGLDHYQFQLDDTPDFSSPVIDQPNVGSSTYTPGAALNPVTTYYWRVRAFNSTGQASDWSPAFTFITAPLPPPAHFPDTIQPPQGLRPFFDWDDVAGASTYTLQISTDRNFAALTANLILPTSAHIAASDLPRGTTLYWRVRANNLNGSGNWSPAKSFDSPNPPGAPTLLSPLGGLTTSNNLPRLDWADSIPAPERYEVQIATDPNFVNVLGRGQGGPATISEYTSEVPLAASTYYWRVRAFGGASPNGQLLFGDWSATGSFKTP
jgi:Zn-dependent metalloprotease